MGWEYRIVYVGTESLDEDEYEARLHESVHLLNELGGDDWELIGYLPHQMQGRRHKYHAVLKRPKEVQD